MPELGTSGSVGGPGWATTQVYPSMPSTSRKTQSGGVLAWRSATSTSAPLTDSFMSDFDQGCTWIPAPSSSRIDSSTHNVVLGVNTSAAARTPVYFAMTGAAAPPSYRVLPHRLQRHRGRRIAGWAVLLDGAQGQQRRPLRVADAGEGRDVQALVPALGP